VLERVGLFDERFFLYYEDSDYCMRVRRAGFRLLVVPQARMWHRVSSSTEGSDSPTERYWMGYSSIQFFRKHVRLWQLPVIIPWRVGSIVKTLLRLVISGHPSKAFTYLRGIFGGLRH
jgi:GT2 family glycosyltransferase